MLASTKPLAVSVRYLMANISEPCRPRSAMFEARSSMLHRMQDTCSRAALMGMPALTDARGPAPELIMGVAVVVGVRFILHPRAAGDPHASTLCSHCSLPGRLAQ